MRVIERWLDEGLGPDGRLWMYHETLQVRRAMRPWIVAGIPRGERRCLRGRGLALDPFVRRYLGVDASAARAALASVERVFDEIAARLADGRSLPDRRPLHRGRPDLRRAQRVACSCRRGYGSPLPQPEQLPAAMAAEVRRLREHPAGRFAARLYEDERWPAATGVRPVPSG